MVLGTKTKAKPVDPTGKRLFFQLLHMARLYKSILPGIFAEPEQRAAITGYLLGMGYMVNVNRKDFTIADNARSYWANLNAGSAK